MRYADLIQFDPIEAPVLLHQTDAPAQAKRLVETFVISEEIADHLARTVFPYLRSDNDSGARGLLITGAPGIGKSHLLAMLASIAEQESLVPFLIDSQVAQASLGFAGHFKVLRTDLGSTRLDLRAFVCRHIAEALPRWGVQCSFPPEGPPSNPQARFADLMAAFRREFPGRGLLFLVDELLHYLCRRDAAALERDLSFLREISETCVGLNFRFIAGLREKSADDPAGGFVTQFIRQAQDCLVPISIPSTNARFVAGHRLLRKTTEQQATVRAYLAPFAKHYGNMLARMDEFVTLFPIHPDYLDFVGRIRLGEQQGYILTVLSDETKKILNHSVPLDHPGFIAFDSYWETLRKHPESSSVPELQAVIHCARRLEAAVARSAISPKRRKMALRIIHALAVHRLGTGDVYSKSGITPAELRDTLCLPAAAAVPPEPSVAAADNEDSSVLLSEVVATLGELQNALPGNLLSVNSQDNQYCLHFKKFRRFVTPELLLHWVNAVPFVLLILTGGIMIAARFCNLNPVLFKQTVAFHKICALSWVFLLPLVILLRPRVHWAHLRVMLKWGREDIVWVLQTLRGLHEKDAPMSPSGRFNTGQKINACLVIFYFFGFAVTGTLMFLKGTMLFPWYIHTFLFVNAMGSVGGHLYLATINPSTRIALAGIFHGWAPFHYVEHHHPLSGPQSLRSHVAHAASRTLLGEVLVASKALIRLAIAVMIAALAFIIFNQWQLASIKAQFAKSFSDCIQPGNLSTRHRLAKTAESCIKCHSYSGEISSAKCEECHADIKQRRATLTGYHGTFKGECVSCHKEHPTGSATLVVLSREKFDHRLADFKRDGKHAQVACDECHQKKRSPAMPGIYFTGLKYNFCTDCHGDPHNAQFPGSCERCHSAEGWTGDKLKFVHNANSSFKLLDKHQAVACLKCHKPKDGTSLASAIFKGIGTKCANCHEEIHRKQFAAECSSCHSTAGWTGEHLDFVHNQRSKFRLEGKHTAVACIKCHKPRDGTSLASAIFKGIGTKCANCHEDIHRKQFAAECNSCHSTAGWTGEHLDFVHNQRSKFKLEGKHTAVACIKCHTPSSSEEHLGLARFLGLKTECGDCHKDPHRGQLDPRCVKCHPIPASWTVSKLQFVHNRDTKFALAGKHTVVECIKCHKPQSTGGSLASGQFKGLAVECVGCHKVKHPDQYGSVCLSCHTPDLWPKKNPGMDHIFNITVRGENLSGKHLSAKCVACHDGIKIGVLRSAGRSDYDCKTCHQADDPHKGVLGTDCAKCHRSEGWKGEDLRFDHATMASFTLDQDHRKLACAKCHQNGKWKPLSGVCESCHKKEFLNKIR